MQVAVAPTEQDIQPNQQEQGHRAPQQSRASKRCMSLASKPHVSPSLRNTLDGQSCGLNMRRPATTTWADPSASLKTGHTRPQSSLFLSSASICCLELPISSWNLHWLLASFLLFTVYTILNSPLQPPPDTNKKPYSSTQNELRSLCLHHLLPCSVSILELLPRHSFVAGQRSALLFQLYSTNLRQSNLARIYSVVVDWFHRDKIH